MDGRRSGQTKVDLQMVDAGQVSSRSDVLATEEPMEIRLRYGTRTQPVAVTMRTPGDDFELAAGFLFAEGIVSSRDPIGRVEYCVDCEGDSAQQYNIVTVAVRDSTVMDQFVSTRNFGMTSACGLCGRERLDQIEIQGLQRVADGPELDFEVIVSLSEKLRDAQGLFETTGGLHAAGLFSAEGDLIALREDVGRHNAVDKVIGWALLESKLPLSNHILMVSGRSSFEIAQKALAAGIPALCAVSAPSSLSVDLARRFGMTLIGFLRGKSFNVYAGGERIKYGPS